MNSKRARAGALCALVLATGAAGAAESTPPELHPHALCAASPECRAEQEAQRMAQRQRCAQDPRACDKPRSALPPEAGKQTWRDKVGEGRTKD